MLVGGAWLLSTLLSDIRLGKNVAYSGNNASKWPCKSRYSTKTGSSHVGTVIDWHKPKVGSQKRIKTET